ncbi:MAG: glycoside hydrolase [Butyrivibrio sp.]|nr:glycoside hydrolase [Butyrivibrio sp.]
MYKIETKKDVIKIIRSILQLIVLIWAFSVAARALFTFTEYRPFDRNDKSVVSGEDHGFVALSYLGVDRDSTSSRISEKKLNGHLKALHDNGYVTITQRDIEEYYNEGKPLPDRALFLMFEDGRQDTSIFAQNKMEDYNYKGTMFTYAEKFKVIDSFFLMPEDLLKLEKTGFWELGSNGYRLSFINVFDRYNRYIGELESTEYSAMARYLGRDYNHYLMDYIRDANDIPMETYSQMKSRISGDYQLLQDAYTEGMEKVPTAYVLLHANTGRFGENEKVSAVNEEAITGIFTMNFNREGYSLNTRQSSIYDLTRMQPQPNWYTNHLLMRIWDDLPEEDRDDLKFIVGDATQKEKWELQKGAVEYDKKAERIALTSLPEDSGRLKLGVAVPRNISLSTVLKGNKVGSQSVFLRSDEDRTHCIELRLMNNVLSLVQDGNVLEEVDLYEFDETPRISVDEDKRDSLAGEYKALARYAVSHRQSVEYTGMANDVLNTPALSVEDGADEYRPGLKINEMGNRKLEIDLWDNRITVRIDGKTVWDNYRLEASKAGGVYLEGAFGEYGYSQRNIADDVYDAVFERLEIKNLDTGEIVYSYRLQGLEKWLQAAKNIFDAVVNWFIKNI